MRASLAASDFFTQRDADAAPSVIVINRAQNLTSDVLSEAELWMLLARLRGAMPITELAARKNIRFQIAPERHLMLERAGFEGDLGSTEPPTHVLTANFRSTSRAARHSGLTDTRAEYYYLEYEIIDLRRGEVTWTDSFEFKREALGLVID